MAPDVVHVWTLDLDAPPVPLGVAEATLTPDERARASRFLLERERVRHIFARGGLRLLLGHHLRRDPAAVPLRYSPLGKPRLAAEAGSALRFNLAHSGSRIVYALALDRELGVDVERVRAIADTTDISRRFFSEAEHAALMSLRGPRRLLAFYRCWTRKEAFLKALGEGLTRPLSAFDVGVAPEAQPRVLRAAWAPGGSWALSDLDVTPGYVGALAIEGRPPVIRPWRWGDAAVDLC